MRKYLKIRSKNATADALRGKVITNKNIVLRLGSITPLEEIFPRQFNREPIHEINTIQACKNSGNKITMKKLFAENGVKTAIWEPLSWEARLRNDQNEPVEPWNLFPAIIKHINSSKGNGIFYIANANELVEFVDTHHNDLNKYIIEKYYTYSKEYRLHVTKDGCFYTCRKMLKQDAEERWHRHDNNSVWILEENELFEKPNNWDAIVTECVKAMHSVGLDMSAIDVKTQSGNGNVDFIILETNSAPSLGEITTIKYIEQLKIMANEF